MRFRHDIDVEPENCHSVWLHVPVKIDFVAHVTYVLSAVETEIKIGAAPWGEHNLSFRVCGDTAAGCENFVYYQRTVPGVGD